MKSIRHSDAVHAHVEVGIKELDLPFGQCQFRAVEDGLYTYLNGLLVHPLLQVAPERVPDRLGDEHEGQGLFSLNLNLNDLFNLDNFSDLYLHLFGDLHRHFFGDHHCFHYLLGRGRAGHSERSNDNHRYDQSEYLVSHLSFTSCSCLR